MNVRFWGRGPTTPPRASTTPTASTPTAPTPTAAPNAATTAGDVQRADLQKLLGVGPQKTAAGLGGSAILDVLGRDRFVDVPCVRVPGRVAWVNYELARSLGFPVGDGNVMGAELEKALLDHLAFRALKPGEDPAGRTVMNLHADRYGGSGIANNGGAGRAAFLPWGNLNIKGVGLTPLAVLDHGDIQHSHGGAPMREGMVEAIWGEVGSNLFAQGSTRILAVIDVDDHTQWPDGSREKRALIVRATDQLRPAHLLAGWTGDAFTPDAFARMAEHQGVLVKGSDGQLDVAATMHAIVDRHAATAAEQWRWRVVHGALSTGNMQIAGRQLDLATMSSQPRTSAIQTLGHGGAYGLEHHDRATELQRVFDAVDQQLGPRERNALHAAPVDVAAAMATAYARHLDRQVLDACGLKPSLARALQADVPVDVHALADVVTALSELHNGAKNLLADKVIVDDSVVDVFHLLGALPAALADGRPLTKELVVELLRPHPIGSERAKAEARQRLDRLVDRFVHAWPAVMGAARARAADHYDTVEAMDLSVRRRAAFENRPLDRLYKAQLHAAFDHVIDEYERTKDPRLFNEAVDQAASASLRSVEALLGAGRQRRVEGGVEINVRAIDGVEYCVRALENGRRRLVADLSVQRDGDGWRLSTVAGAPWLSNEMLQGLRYRFTTDHWATTLVAEARLVDDGAGNATLRFEAPASKSDVGLLEGVFHTAVGGDVWIKDGASNFRGYAFAVPDQRELQELLTA